MATNLLHLRPSVVKACATPNRTSENTRRKPSSTGNWWAPLFGWSSEPDYIDSSAAGSESPMKKSDLSLSQKSSPRFSPGCFTEEKAKRLRRLTKDSAFHDVMYHSAIASRLASDFKDSSSDLSD